jgi:hypothetical protein
MVRFPRCPDERLHHPSVRFRLSASDDEALGRADGLGWRPDARFRVRGAGLHLRRVNLIERQRDQRDSEAVSYVRAHAAARSEAPSLQPFVSRTPGRRAGNSGPVCIGTEQDLSVIARALQRAIGATAALTYLACGGLPLIVA